MTSSQIDMASSQTKHEPDGVRVSWVIAALALTPCVMSLWFSVSSSELPPLTVTQKRPPLLFATYLYHHGDEPVDPGTTLESEFRFRNEGDSPVTIGDIERSCGCMSPRLSSKVVAPGEIASIYVPIQTINQSPGPHEYLLTVHYEDSKPHQTTLAIKATFPEKMVVVQPKALYLSQRSSKAIPFNVAISHFRDETLQVEHVESSVDFVKAAIRTTSGGEIVQTGHSDALQVSKTEIDGEVAGAIPPGRHHVVVAAATTDLEFSVISVPMIVNGPAYPEGEAPTLSTSHIQLTASERAGARRSAKLQLIMPVTWEISHASAWPSELSVTYGTPTSVTDREQVVPIEVALSQLPQQKIIDGVVQLTANGGRNLVTAKVSLAWP